MPCRYQMYRNKTGLFSNKKTDRHFEPDEEVLQEQEEENNDLSKTGLTWTMSPVVNGVTKHTLDIINNNEINETSFHVDKEGADYISDDKE